MSYSGLQLSVWSLRGPVVSMVAQAHLLCVVYHTAMPLPSHQCLAVLVMDVERRQRLLDGPLAISPGSTLTWLGYSDRSALLTMDSAGVVRVLSDQWGGQWVPVLDVGGAAGKASREAHWPVGLMDDRLMCCVCKGGLKVPNTVNRPVLSAVPLRLPFLQTETVQHEEQHARQDMLLYQQHRHRHQTAAAGSSSSLPFAYSPTAKEQASLDKLLLPLVQLACKADAGSRAVDVASRLGLLRSMELCLTLANSSRKVALSSRISLMIGARRKEKEEEKERERRRQAVGEGAAISIEGFMEKGEKRADEERKRRQERKQQEDDALRSSSAQAEAEAEQDAGDEGETELTYSRKGKKRVKLVERSEVDRQREEQQREEREEREAEEQKKTGREAEAKAAQQLVEDDDDVAVTGQSESSGGGKAVDFLTQFKRQKEREVAEKERQRREQQEKEKEKEKAKQQQQKKKTAATKKAKGDKGEKGEKEGNKKAATGKKGKEKENEKDKASRDAASEGEKEKEKDSESQKDDAAAADGGNAAAAFIGKPKPVNPFAKRTFADIAAPS